MLDLGQHERPVFLVLRCPKLQSVVSCRRSALLSTAGPQLHHKVSVIWKNTVCVFTVVFCPG